MGYYDALVAKWSTLTGTTSEKLDAVNALTVPGPNVDVQISAVVGVMALSGAYLSVSAFAQGSSNGSPTHDAALSYAKLFISILTMPNAPSFAMSDPTDNAVITGMMDAILAQETAVPGSTGFTQAIRDKLIALSATSLPWWKASVADGGGGLSSTVSVDDLIEAGGLV